MRTPENKKKEENLQGESRQNQPPSMAARPGGLDERDLVLRAKEGDENAFEKLVEKYDRRVLSLAFSYTRNSDDAKDIYQDTLIRAFRSIKNFEMRSEFSTWLYRIATNVCLSFKSNQSRDVVMFRRTTWRREESDDEIVHVDPPVADNAERDFMRAELAKQIEKAMQLLSPMQRLVFTMKHYEGYKLREIATFMKCTEGTVKKHLFVAVRRLQGELKGVYE